MASQVKPTPTVTIIRPEDVQAGWAYPYLPTEWGWEIRNIPFACLADEETRLAEAGQEPTLRLVKDDKVVDIHVPGMDSQVFLHHWGLVPSFAKGGYLLSKRLSRLFHPYQFFSFFAPDEVRIVHRPDWDAALWDGCGCVSRRFLLELLLPRLASDLSAEEYAAYEAELRQVGRWEITVLHADGEEKGDVLVFDSLPGDADFLFPAGSAKGELHQEGVVFVGLAQARYAKVGMRLDAQSVINLHPFFAPEQLLAWTAQESALFLEALETGEAGRLYPRLAQDEAEETQAKRASWHVAEYLMRGGDVRHFAGITRELGRQHQHRLLHRVERKLRFPAPGGRFYLMPATVGDRDVPPGHIELDRTHATAWVADEDWLGYLVRVLGGCDGDDGVWVFPFTDAADGEQKVLIWRSPNQAGEYVLLRPTARSTELTWALPGGETLMWPEMDSRLLPPRVDTIAYQYATLTDLDTATDAPDAYTIRALDATIRLAMGNQGTLGSWCNLQMVLKAVDGQLPLALPATLETIIDASVKRFLDLTPVLAWIAETAAALVEAGKAVPACLRERLLPLLEKRDQARLQLTTDHWLDELGAGVRTHLAWYQAEVEVLAAQAMPPVAFFGCVDPAYKAQGRTLRQRYAEVLRQGGTQEAARRSCEAFLADHPEAERHQILLAAAAACYVLGKHDLADPFSDNVIWQLGAKVVGADGKECRLPGIAQAFNQALVEIGLLGALGDDPAPLGPAEAVPVTVNGVWANWLRLAKPDLPAAMSQIPEPLRAKAKRAIEELTDSRFVGLTLQAATEGERLVLYTGRGNLFGYVQKGHEVRLGAVPSWRVAWALAHDGNVHAVLLPAA